jgi:hypothetical protein
MTLSSQINQWDRFAMFAVIQWGQGFRAECFHGSPCLSISLAHTHTHTLFSAKGMVLVFPGDVVWYHSMLHYPQQHTAGATAMTHPFVPFCACLLTVSESQNDKLSSSGLQVSTGVHALDLYTHTHKPPPNMTTVYEIWLSILQPLCGHRERDLVLCMCEGHTLSNEQHLFVCVILT